MAMTRHNRSAAFRGASPWSLGDRVGLLLWQFAWPLLCGWTPKPFNPWRLWVLRRFGASVVGRPFVHSRARIQVPWNITLHDRSCVGDRANLYSLDRITLGEGALAAQESYLCTGTHDLADPAWPLLTAPIALERDAFVGARAFVMPGVTIGAKAVVGACSVVTKSVPDGTVVAGNPATPLGKPASQRA
jgi:putative colanic acid biosynthesis acetyltransferase WcaF